MDLSRITRQSSSSSVINIVAPANGKSNNMQLFVRAYLEYKQQRTEKLSTELIRYLQLLSVTIDYRIFDPTTSFALDFFLCLRELISKVEYQQSTISWCCVNVLKTACKNPTARTALITNHHFIAPLCELLNDELETEKKVKILRLMQELTCGITISWQISYLPHLMTTLSGWIVNENEDVIILSLAILVNLCYKNLPSIYTLCRCVDVKVLLRHCLHGLEGPKVEMQVCKLLIILDYMDGSVPKPLVKKLITVLFATIFESFKENDSFYMRHSLEFFIDFRIKHDDVDVILKSEDSERAIRILLEKNLPSDTSTHSPSCTAILLSFLNVLANLLPATILSPFYRRILHLCFQWIHTETVSTHALHLIRTIIIDHTRRTTYHPQRELDVIQEEDEDEIDEATDEDGATIDDIIVESLPLLRVIVECVEQVVSVEECKSLVAVLELFRVLIEMDRYKEEIIELLQDINLINIFDVLHGQTDSTSCPLDLTSMEAVALFVNYLAIINELSKYRTCWFNDITTLLNHKQVHNVLAQALYQGNEDTKHIVLVMASSPQFPTKDFAKVMTDMNKKVFKPNSKSADDDKDLVGRFNPVLSYNQSQRLDDLLDQIREDVADKGHLYASATDIIELYDYKIACFRESEEMSKNSLNAASAQCVQYQIKLAQLTAEANKLQLQVIGVEERFDNVLTNNDALKTANDQLAKRIKEEHRRRMLLKNDYEVLHEEKTNQIQELESRVEVLNNTLTFNETKNKRIRDKLVEDVRIKEANQANSLKVVGKLNKNLQIERTSNEVLMKKIKDLENRIQDKCKALDKAQKEVSGLQDRLKIIFKVVTK